MAASRGASPSTVVVHLRNLSSPYGTDLDHRILDFQSTEPRLSSGQSITVQSETGDYKQMLEKQTTSDQDVDLIVLDSSGDATGNPALMSALEQRGERVRRSEGVPQERDGNYSVADWRRRPRRSPGVCELPAEGAVKAAASH